jgi:hypothetical protein
VTLKVSQITGRNIHHQLIGILEKIKENQNLFQLGIKDKHMDREVTAQGYQVHNRDTQHLLMTAQDLP